MTAKIEIFNLFGDLVNFRMIEHQKLHLSIMVLQSYLINHPTR